MIYLDKFYNLDIYIEKGSHQNYEGKIINHDGIIINYKNKIYYPCHSRFEFKDQLIKINEIRVEHYLCISPSFIWFIGDSDTIKIYPELDWIYSGTEFKHFLFNHDIIKDFLLVEDILD